MKQKINWLFVLVGVELILVILTLMIAYVWAKFDFDLEPELAFLSALVAVIGLAVGYLSAKKRGEKDSNGKPLSPKAISRKRLINNVQSRVSEELNKNIHEQKYLKLRMKNQAEHTGLELDLKELPAGQLVPKNNSLLKVYNNSRQSLLILGEPASGKTIVLYRLAQLWRSEKSL